MTTLIIADMSNKTRERLGLTDQDLARITPPTEKGNTNDKSNTEKIKSETRFDCSRR